MYSNECYVPDPLFHLLNEEQKEQIREIIFERLLNSVEKVNFDVYAKKFIDKVVLDTSDSIKRFKIYESDLDQFKEVILDKLKDELKKAHISYDKL